MHTKQIRLNPNHTKNREVGSGSGGKKRRNRVKDTFTKQKRHGIKQVQVQERKIHKGKGFNTSWSGELKSITELRPDQESKKEKRSVVSVGRPTSPSAGLQNPTGPSVRPCKALWESAHAAP